MSVVAIGGGVRLPIFPRPGSLPPRTERTLLRGAPRAVFLCNSAVHLARDLRVAPILDPMLASSLPNHSTNRAFSVPALRTRQLRLLPNGDGWSLVTLDGELVFSSLGTGGRRECLNYAATHGVVALST